MVTYDRSAGGRPPIYSWGRFLDGNDKTLTRGRDFEVDVRDFQNQLLAQARKTGIKVRTEVRVSTGHADGRTYTNEHLRLRFFRNSKHRWNELLDGQPHLVEYAALRTTSPESFIRQARRAASERGLSLRIIRKDWAMQIQAEQPPPFPIAGQKRDGRLRQG